MITGIFVIVVSLIGGTLFYLKDYLTELQRTALVPQTPAAPPATVPAEGSAAPAAAAPAATSTPPGASSNEAMPTPAPAAPAAEAAAQQAPANVVATTSAPSAPTPASERSGKPAVLDAPPTTKDSKPARTPPPRSSEQPRSLNAPLIVAREGGLHPLVSAYSALVEGRLDVAAEGYRQALSRNPEERDALLGLAHIAHRQGRREEARTYYQRVLRLDPENAAANSGLLAILAEGDPQSAVSRAREVAERNPDSAAAFSALGTILAREGQIADAQQAYFRAFSLEPGNALHAYNLAVALDRLHKHDLARNYYRRALELSEKQGGAAFPKDSARTRLEQLRSEKPRD